MAAENTNNSKLITNLALIAGGYFLIVKPILETFGFKKTEERLATEAANKKSIDDYVRETQKTQKPTKLDSEWKLIADQIYADLRYSALDDNKADAVYQMCRPKNDADIALLIKYFGKRREYLFGIPSGGLQNLTQFIISNISKKNIDIINGNYSRKKIKFRI